MVQPGDTIGTCECPSCGTAAPLKISKNRTVYSICSHPLERDPSGKVIERCGHRTFIGRVKSRQLIKQFEESHVEPEIRQPDRDSRALEAGKPASIDEQPGPVEHAPEPVKRSSGGIFGFLGA